MSQFLKSAKLILLDGKFDETIIFNKGLNIISGENGTLKTKVLQSISTSLKIEKQNFGAESTLSSSQAIVDLDLNNNQIKLRALFISPKRNSERKNILAIIERFRSTMPGHQNEMGVFNNIDDSTFRQYPSLGELFYKVYSEKCKLGGESISYMNEVVEEFNIIISKIFSNYKLLGKWDSVSGQPEIKLDKGQRGIVPIESLSLGEQEILSLVLNIYHMKDKFDTLFIDEPEIHLNWHLEDKLFKYFQEFCLEFNKQLVIVSHSRVIFWEEFLKITKFFYWTDFGKISVSDKPSDTLKKILAGEVVEIIRMGDFSKPTFFVEDISHENVVTLLAKKYNVEINCTRCDNSTNVKSLYKYSKLEQGWSNAFFLKDGDNEGNPFPGDNNFICLEKYCIENYFLDQKILSEIFGCTELEVQVMLLKIVLSKRSSIMKKNKYLDFLFDRLEATDLTPEFLSKLDASEFFQDIIDSSSIKTKSEFMDKYIEVALRENIIESVLPKTLIDCIKSLK